MMGNRGRAVEGISAAALGDLDLPPAKGPLADHADPFVIERIPMPLEIRGAQDSEPIFRGKMRDHTPNRSTFGRLGNWAAGNLQLTEKP